jgi:hypothetical protein
MASSGKCTKANQHYLRFAFNRVSDVMPKLQRVAASFRMGQDTTTGDWIDIIGLQVFQCATGAVALLQADCCFYIRCSAQIVALSVVLSAPVSGVTDAGNQLVIPWRCMSDSIINPAATSFLCPLTVTDIHHATGDGNKIAVTGWIFNKWVSGKHAHIINPSRAERLRGINIPASRCESGAARML